MFGRKLKDEITKLTYRVAELEERLCPCESHKWKKVDWFLSGGTGRGDEITSYIYKCERCGKKATTIQPFLDREETEYG